MQDNEILKRGSEKLLNNLNNHKAVEPDQIRPDSLIGAAAVIVWFKNRLYIYKY